jgi:hypothetical protein
VTPHFAARFRRARGVFYVVVVVSVMLLFLAIDSGLARPSNSVELSGTKSCPLLNSSQASASLGQPTRVLNATKQSCTIAGTLKGRPMLSVNLFAGEGRSFTEIVTGKARPIVGFLPPGNSMASFLRNSVVIQGTRVYGEQVHGHWGLHRTEFSFVGAKGSSVISVGVISANGPKHAAMVGMSYALRNATAS